MRTEPPLPTKDKITVYLMRKNQKIRRFKTYQLLLGSVLLCFVLATVLIYTKSGNSRFFKAVTTNTSVQHFAEFLKIITPSPTPTPKPTPTPPPTPTPTPRQLTFNELNSLYGPCAVVPALMYHHVQDLTTAKAEGHGSLTVDTGIFQKQMQYLKDHGYNPIRPEQLIAFFDSGSALPGKPVLLTFDDGYDDFNTDAAPILQNFGFTATAFIPTGLLQNPGYMSWGNLADISGRGLIYFANHTWSHHNVSTSLAEDQKEIGTADTQLAEHGLNPSKVFAYPYGNPSANGETVLSQLGYKLGFTTYPGSTQCRGRRFVLSRTRIGNTVLSAYGL